MALQSDKVQIEMKLDNSDVISKLSLHINTNKELSKEQKELGKNITDYEKKLIQLDDKLVNLDKDSKNYEKTKQRLTKEVSRVSGALVVAKNEFNTNSISVSKNEAAILADSKAMGTAAMTTNQLRTYLNLLGKEYDNLDPKSKEFAETLKEQQKAQETLDRRKVSVPKTTSILDGIKGNLPAALTGGLAGAAAVGAGQIISNLPGQIEAALQDAAKLSDTFADIRKATGLTEDEVKKLNTTLSKVDTRTPTEELRKIVVVAGQMGIANKDIESFTIATDKLVVALNDEFKGGAEEITNVFGKLRNTLSDIKTDNVSQDILLLGNAVNVLGQAGLATGPVVTDIAQRIGASGQIYGLTAGQTLGLAASFQEMGITAERGGTAVTKIIGKIAKSPQDFAKIAGMGTAEFKRLVDTDIATALLKVSEGFAKSKGSATQFAEKLADASVNSEAIKEVLAKVGQNGQLVADKIKLAGDALKNTSSIEQEFALKNENFAANLAKAGKVWERFTTGISSLLKNMVEPFVGLIGLMGKSTEDLSAKFIATKANTDKLESSTRPLLTRYNELQPLVKGNATAQRELNGVIADLGKLVPSAVTQFDKYGNALKVNLGLINQFLDAQKKTTELAKIAAINETNRDINSLALERKNLLSSIEYVQKEHEKYSKGKLYTDAETSRLVKLRDNLKSVSEQITEKQKLASQFNTDVTITEPPKPPKKTPSDIGDNSDKESSKATKEHDKLEKQAEDKRKFIEEEAAKRIELQAELAFQEDLKLADEENKKVLKAEQEATKKQADLEKEYREKTAKIKEIFAKDTTEQKNQLALQSEALKTATEANEKDLGNTVLAIREEAKEKRIKQIQEQTAKAVEIANKASLEEKQARLQKAENKGDSKGVLGAKTDLNIQSYLSSLDTLEVNYQKQQKSLEGNNDALEQLNKNYFAESNLLTQKYVDDQAKITDEYHQKKANKANKNKVDSLSLDVQQAEQTPGGNVATAQVALLDEQLNQDIAFAEKTGQKTTDIYRKYELEKAAIGKAQRQKDAEQAIQLFGQAFSTISGLFGQRIQNEQQLEDERFQSTTSKLDEEKEHKIITDSQYKKAKIVTEKAHDKEVKKLRYEQAKIEKANNITQAVMNGIQAVMKGYAQTGPFGGTFGAVIMGAITEAQIATIASQKLPSLFSGGPTPMSVDKPIDNLGGFLAINHPGEYMVSAAMRKTPVFAAVEPMLESIRLKGRAFYNGGPVDNTPMANITTTAKDEKIEKLTAHIERMDAVFSKFSDKVDNLKVYLGGHDYEKIHEGLSDVTKQNNDSLITNTKTI